MVSLGPCSILQLFPIAEFSKKKDLPGDLIAEVHARRARDPRKFQEAMRDAGRVAGPRQGAGVHSHSWLPQWMVKIMDPKNFPDVNLDDLGVPPWIGNLHIYRFFRQSTLNQHTKKWWNWELATNHGSMCQQKRGQTWNSNRTWWPRGSNTNHGNRKPKCFNSGMLYWYCFTWPSQLWNAVLRWFSISHSTWILEIWWFSEWPGLHVGKAAALTWHDFSRDSKGTSCT